MVEAAEWLIVRGQRLWNPESLVPAKICPRPEEGTIYLARSEGRPFGTFILLFEDPIWPDVPAGEALYIHKLAVLRSAAGTGLSRAMLEYAVGLVRAAGRPYLRLDCAPRPKLYELYESVGFHFHSLHDIGGFTLRRYQRAVKPLP
jgi:GNAT superfamily N-acetyltransferase